MENIKLFLESSTIHGLAHISATRKTLRLFWIVVVFVGFIGAGIIIFESFQSWGESPITTTLETRSITELKFPKVTVCPPKNTFTDLNNYLIMAEKITLDSDARSELQNYAEDVLNDLLFEIIKTNLKMIQDKDRYNNWYHGYTEIVLPAQDKRFGTELAFHIRTSALSGTLSTQYFGEQYEAEKVPLSFDYSVKIFPPTEVLYNANATLHLEVQKVHMNNLGRGYDTFYITRPSDYRYYDDIKADVQEFEKKYTPPKRYQYIRLNRWVEGFFLQNLDKIPGFNVTWYYSGMEVTPWAKYYNSDSTIGFVRLVNAIHLTDIREDKIWSIVRKIISKAEKFDGLDAWFCDPPNDRIAALEQQLKVESSGLRLNNITAGDLQTAAEILIHFYTCPESLKNWFNFYTDLFQTQSPNKIVLTLNRLLKGTNQDFESTITKILQKVNDMLELKYENMNSDSVAEGII